MPPKSKHIIVQSLRDLAELAIAFTDDERDDCTLVEILNAIYNLVEVAKIISYIEVWEKIRAKYVDSSIAHKA